MSEAIPPRILLFTGYAGAGKTTAAKCVVDMQNALRPGTALRLSLAEPLRELCMTYFPKAPRKAFYGAIHDKEAPLEAYPGWTGRKILQHIGTEGLRHVDPGIWVNLLLHKIAALPAHTEVVAVDDVRFPDEVRGLIELPKAKLVRVHRPGTTSGKHASEVHVDYFEADAELDNSGDILTLPVRLARLLSVLYGFNHEAQPGV